MIRCLIVDDSRTFRIILRDILSKAPGVQVVGEAIDGEEALARAIELRPDVITMDVRMPRVNGLEAIREIMYQMPTPIVVVSAQAEGVSFHALQLGAIDVVAKPRDQQPGQYDRETEAIRTAVRSVAGLKLVGRRRPPAGDALLPTRLIIGKPAEGAPSLHFPPRAMGLGRQRRPAVIGIAASTGGPQAICRILASLPADFPVPILVVQHIADGFEEGLVQWLASEARVKVKVAEDAEPLLPATVYFGPNGKHLAVHKDRIHLGDEPPVRGFKPSGTVLFSSLADQYSARAVGVILSGMGEDGALGLLHLRERGGLTVSQGPVTSVVYGMPRAAYEIGAVLFSLEIEEIPGALLKLAGIH
jgi:two-component system chemotaxis response regulator CheB